MELSNQKTSSEVAGNQLKPLAIATPTPWPWTVDSTSLPGIVDVRDSQGRMLAAIYAPQYNGHPVRHQEAEANACLIAAAPEMLEALDALHSLIESRSPIYKDAHIAEWVKLAEAAIRKAKGEL